MFEVDTAAYPPLQHNPLHTHKSNISGHHQRAVQLSSQSLTPTCLCANTAYKHFQSAQPPSDGTRITSTHGLTTLRKGFDLMNSSPVGSRPLVHSCLGACWTCQQKIVLSMFFFKEVAELTKVMMKKRKQYGGWSTCYPKKKVFSFFADVVTLCNIRRLIKCWRGRSDGVLSYFKALYAKPGDTLGNVPWRNLSEESMLRVIADFKL